ncbi:GTPase [Filifactor villosus]|uniref:GTPase n=1 Tax=Filifactor villosus TaxID=29374 RepID=A0ABV9QIU4_9FIRM
MVQGIYEKKKDFASKLKDIATEFSQYVSDEFCDHESGIHQELEEKVIQLLDVEKPKIMVYGIYNSGKSTLINAMCREEVAEMADRPMTAEISEYDKGEYILVDSPGVDAPIEHEQVTQEFLDKCHVILFVMSTKGLFEDRSNYKRLASLILKGVPFIIVLNDRGTEIKKEWDQERKSQVKALHQEELNTIQHKVIKNLIRESNDSKIADKYEVVVLNAKKALTGVLRERAELFKSSGVERLEQRIEQFIRNDKSVKALFSRPISNIKDLMDNLEKVITQQMIGDKSEEFERKMDSLLAMKNNLTNDLRIMAKQSVNNVLEELTNSYFHENYEALESVANQAIFDINEKYSMRMTSFMLYIQKNFEDSVYSTNHSLEVENLDAYKLHSFSMDDSGEYVEGEEEQLPKKPGFWDFLKSRKKKEQEKKALLQKQVEARNRNEEYKLHETIRKKQEARQFASSDLDDLLRRINAAISRQVQEVYDEQFGRIQSMKAHNIQIHEDCMRKMQGLSNLRKKLEGVENMLA